MVHFHQSKCPGRHRRMSRRLLIGSQRSDAVYSYRLNSSKNIDGSIFNRIEYSTRANRCARMPSKIFFVSLYNYPSFHTKISHDNFFMFTKKNISDLSTGDIKGGLPSFSLPPFSINRTDESNNTVWLSFPDICSELGAAIGLIPLIAILEQVAIAKSFGKHPISSWASGRII